MGIVLPPASIATLRRSPGPRTLATPMVRATSSARNHESLTAQQVASRQRAQWLRYVGRNHPVGQIEQQGIQQRLDTLGLLRRVLGIAGEEIRPLYGKARIDRAATQIGARRLGGRGIGGEQRYGCVRGIDVVSRANGGVAETVGSYAEFHGNERLVILGRAEKFRPMLQNVVDDRRPADGRQELVEDHPLIVPA